VIGSLIAAFLSGEAGLAIERTKRAAVAYAIAGILALVGVIFLLIAAYAYAAREFGPITAALGFGIGFVLIGGIVIAVHQIRARIEQKRIAARRKKDLAGLGATAAIAAIPTLLQGRGGKASGAAALILPAAITVAIALYRRRRDADHADE
jgi:uncharacterized membrane protein (DUF485 family)